MCDRDSVRVCQHYTHVLTCLSVADLSAAGSRRFGIGAQSSVLRARAQHCPVFGIAQYSALPGLRQCLGLSCAKLWSVNGHMPVPVGGE